MSKTTIKRKTAGRKAPAKRRPSRARQTSLLNRLLARLPFTEAQLQRAGTFSVLALLVAAALGLAQFFGIPAMAGQQLALAAGKAGFEVKKVEVRNVDKMNELAVYEIVLAEKDRSMAMVDIAALREELTQFGWIADARISRQLPDTLIVDIVEREPRAAWDNGKEVVLIDAHGVKLEKVKAGEDPGLLRLKGARANKKVEDLVGLLDKAPALTPLVTEAEWIGNRRWNLTFNSGEVLALPEGKDLSAAALVNFARMDGVNRMLGKGVTYFDMRDPERAYLRKPKKPVQPAAPKSDEPAQTAMADTE